MNPRSISMRRTAANGMDWHAEQGIEAADIVPVDLEGNEISQHTTGTAPRSADVSGEAPGKVELQAQPRIHHGRVHDATPPPTLASSPVSFGLDRRSSPSIQP